MLAGLLGEIQTIYRQNAELEAQIATDTQTVKKLQGEITQLRETAKSSQAQCAAASRDVQAN